MARHENLEQEERIAGEHQNGRQKNLAHKCRGTRGYIPLIGDYSQNEEPDHFDPEAEFMDELLGKSPLGAVRYASRLHVVDSTKTFPLDRIVFQLDVAGKYIDSVSADHSEEEVTRAITELNNRMARIKEICPSMFPGKKGNNGEAHGSYKPASYSARNSMGS